MRNAWLLLAVLVVFIDYFTKQYALSHLTLHESVSFVPCFAFTLIYNTGAAFGFLGSADPTWERWFMPAVSVVGTGLFLYWFFTAKYTLQRVAIALVIGGAVGNFIDRAFVGHVIDFIDIYIGPYHWPAFNIADMAICGGIILLIFSWMKYDHD